LNNVRLTNLAALFDRVHLKHSAVALACAATCSLTLAQDYGYGRDTAGSTRLYNLPLVSELEADPANCVNNDAGAQAHAAARWAEYQAANGVDAKLPAVAVYQCRTERIVDSVRAGEQLRDVTMGNIITVMPSGTMYYAPRGVGTFEKLTAGIPASPSPAPAPAPDTSWWDEVVSAPPATPAPISLVAAPTPTPSPSSSPAPAPAPAPEVWWTPSPPPPVVSAPTPSYWVTFSSGGGTGEGQGGLIVTDINTGRIVWSNWGNPVQEPLVGWVTGVGLPSDWTPPPPPSSPGWAGPCGGDSC